METIRYTEKISSGQTFTDILNLCCDPDLQCSNPIFPQDTQAYDAVLSNQVSLLTDRLLRRNKRNNNIFFYYISPHCDLKLNTVNQFFCMILLLTMLHIGLVTKCSVVQKILSGQTFTTIF